MKHELDDILPLTFSGVRPDDKREILRLLEARGGPTKDLQPVQLRNFLVARKGGGICAVAGLEIIDGAALLRSLAVDEAYGGQGIGRRLMAALERYASTRKVDRIYLFTRDSKDYFSQLGYAAVDRNSVPEALRDTAIFSRLCSDKAVCMRKRLVS